MTTYDLTEVRSFIDDLTTRMVQCENGEGMECANLDAMLDHHARLCCSFMDQVRGWAREVFSGRVAFDPEVERLWIDEGTRLYGLACEMWRYGQLAEVPCYLLDSQPLLRSALGAMYRLLKGWVTPKLAVGPSARNGLPVAPELVDEVRERIALLPPLPSDWQPEDQRQRSIYRLLKTR